LIQLTFELIVLKFSYGILDDDFCIGLFKTRNFKGGINALYARFIIYSLKAVNIPIHEYLRPLGKTIEMVKHTISE
jgi:hypothetical protein